MVSVTDLNNSKIHNEHSFTNATECLREDLTTNSAKSSTLEMMRREIAHTMCENSTHHPTDFNCCVDKEKTQGLLKVMLSKANVLKSQIHVPSFVKRDFHNHEDMKNVLQ